MKYNFLGISNTLRGLSIDEVQKANSGHPGLPLGIADVASVLFAKHLRFDSSNPDWINRDRFVLSGGHGSALLYSLLHLFGYNVSLEDLKNFRQWNSRTPGHPEYWHVPGIETTTGPLGQGLGNAVGMAMAEAHLAGMINYDEKIINYRTYAVVGDGDLMEGISHEICSFAGHMKLNKLIVFYDKNNITIDGNIDLSCNDNISLRFKAYNWNVIEIYGHDHKEIDRAITKAKKSKNKPTLILCNTIIGFGSPNMQGTSKIHGSPLGKEEVRLTKINLGLPEEEFYVSENVKKDIIKILAKKQRKVKKWNKIHDSFKSRNPELVKSIDQFLFKELDPKIFNKSNFSFPDTIATRSASEIVLNSIFSKIPNLIGGSADLTPSNNTLAKNTEIFDKDNRGGRYIHFGIREHGMGAMMNGMALRSGIIPYGGTFLVFSDYMRPAIRMAAMMGLQVIYIFTHDSIGLGEDGPTHQPMEHLNSLSMIPNMVVFRPMDAMETISGWKIALERKSGPTALVLSRQKLPVYKRGRGGLYSINGASKGGYVIMEDEGFEVILLASGSEVEKIIDAKFILNEKGIKVRLISMPSKELFEIQSNSYKSKMLPDDILKVAIEAGNTIMMERYSSKNMVIGINTFGTSAPYEILYEKFGLTSQKVVEIVLKNLKSKKGKKIKNYET